HGLEARLRRDQRIHQDARGTGDQERVAVGGTLRDELRGDARPRTGLVLHHHRLAERAAERLLEGARHEIRGAAGREADHHAQRPGRIGLRECLRSEQKQKPFHQALHQYRTMWKKIGAEKHTESSRSSMPPCPSIMVPQSLTPRSRLIADITSPPRKPINAITSAIAAASHTVNGV